MALPFFSPEFFFHGLFFSACFLPPGHLHLSDLCSVLCTSAVHLCRYRTPGEPRSGAHSSKRAARKTLCSFCENAGHDLRNCPMKTSFGVHVLSDLRSPHQLAGRICNMKRSRLPPQLPPLRRLTKSELVVQILSLEERAPAAPPLPEETVCHVRTFRIKDIQAVSTEGWTKWKEIWRWSHECRSSTYHVFSAQ